MEKISIELQLDSNGLPQETELIKGLIHNRTLGNFLYAVANDVLEGRYNMEESHNKIVLDQLISTVSSIFETVSSMDTNVSDITESLNKNTEVLSVLEKSGIRLETKQMDKEELENKEQIDFVEISTQESNRDEGGELTLEDDFDDLFDLSMDS